jgi:hypothetical protein
MYTRNCPICNKILTYKGKSAYESALLNQKKCISCAKSGNKLSVKRIPELWIRECVNCGVSKKFKSHATWYNSCKAIKEWKCKSCVLLGKPGHPHTEEHKKYMSDKLKNRKVTWNKKIADSHWSKNEELRKTIIENHSSHMATLIASGKILPNKNKGFKYGHYVNKFGNVEYYRSSYELKRMKELDNDTNVATWTTRHNIKIPYIFNGLQKNYIPDFKIEYISKKIVIEEVKGYINDKDMYDAKVKAAQQWAKINGCMYVVNFMKSEVI